MIKDECQTNQQGKNLCGYISFKQFRTGQYTEDHWQEVFSEAQGKLTKITFSWHSDW